MQTPLEGCTNTRNDLPWWHLVPVLRNQANKDDVEKVHKLGYVYLRLKTLCSLLQVKYGSSPSM